MLRVAIIDWEMSDWMPEYFKEWFAYARTYDPGTDDQFIIVNGGAQCFIPFNNGWPYCATETVLL
jgi:hypothetical protein